MEFTKHTKQSSSLEVSINVEVSAGAGLCDWWGSTHYPWFLILGNTLLKEVGLAFQRNIVHEVERVFCTPYLQHVHIAITGSQILYLLFLKASICCWNGDFHKCFNNYIECIITYSISDVSFSLPGLSLEPRLWLKVQKL